MNQEFKASLKSADTEEHIDIYFYRPIGYQWARFFRMLHVTPNVVTILSIFLGVGAGICFYFDDLAINILGIFLLIWANVYDSCDGQLARLTNQKSALGRILDGAAGDFWFVSIYFAISFRLMPEWGWKIWALCIVAGFGCHAIQSRLADYYRQIHLFFLKGKEGSELDDASKQVELWKQMKWKRSQCRNSSSSSTRTIPWDRSGILLSSRYSREICAKDIRSSCLSSCVPTSVRAVFH